MIATYDGSFTRPPFIPEALEKEADFEGMTVTASGQGPLMSYVGRLERLLIGWDTAASQSIDEASADIWFVGPSQKDLIEIETQRRKNAEAIALITSWLNDESGYDEKTWPRVKKSLEEHRLSDRKLFNE